MQDLNLSGWLHIWKPKNHYEHSRVFSPENGRIVYQFTHSGNIPLNILAIINLIWRPKGLWWLICKRTQEHTTLYGSECDPGFLSIVWSWDLQILHWLGVRGVAHLTVSWIVFDIRISDLPLFYSHGWVKEDIIISPACEYILQWRYYKWRKYCLESLKFFFDHFQGEK